MLLDVDSEYPEILWMSSSDEKVAHVSALTPIDDSCRTWSTRQGDLAPGALLPGPSPIGVHPSGTWSWSTSTPTRCATSSATSSSVTHVAGRLPAWTIRIVVPAHWPLGRGSDRRRSRGVSSRHRRRSRSSHLCSYFECLGSPPTEARQATERARFEKCRRAFSTDRFTALYRLWRQDGERVPGDGFVAVVGHAVESGAGMIEPLVLPHAYSHLAPMVGVE